MDSHDNEIGEGPSPDAHVLMVLEAISGFREYRNSNIILHSLHNTGDKIKIKDHGNRSLVF